MVGGKDDMSVDESMQATANQTRDFLLSDGMHVRESSVVGYCLNSGSFHAVSTASENRQRLARRIKY